MKLAARAAITLALSLASCTHHGSLTPTTLPAETQQQKDHRMAWWRDARFGMFIHWGLYTIPAGTYNGTRVTHIGEWIMNDAKIPVADYAQYAPQFNPQHFSADSIVRLAKSAGMKYIIITSKHHDGFAMFRTAASPYNVFDASPWRHDPIADMAKACHKYGIKLGLYYSQAQDWHHPGGAAAKGHPESAGIKNFKPVDARNHWDPAQLGPMDDYVDKIAVPQVKEILTHYGPIATLWWDTPVDMTHDDAAKLAAAVHAFQPDIITNNRLGAGFQGDTETPEQYIPPTGFPGRDFEVCMTMNDTWGYKSYDDHWKSPETLLKQLIDVSSKGGNYLLNIGPDRDGVVPPPSVERLQQIGAWMDRNGPSIYGTSASPFRKYTFDGRTTVKGNTLFVHVFKWDANNTVTLQGLQTPAKSATSLATHQPVPFTSTPDSLTLTKPLITDPVATVIAVQLAGPPVVDNSAFALKPAADGAFTLLPSTATLGGHMKLVGDGPDQYIGSWAGRRDTVLWDLNVPAPADYTVTLTYSSDDKNAGCTYSVSSTNSLLKGKVDSTSSVSQFRTLPLGTLHLEKGVQPLMVIPVDVPDAHAIMNLKSLTLTPSK